MATQTKDYNFTNSAGGEVKVSICSFPARKGIGIGRRVLSIVKPLGDSVKGLKVKDLFKMVPDPQGTINPATKQVINVPAFSFDKLTEVDVSIGEIVTALLSAADDERIDKLILDLCQTTTINGLDLKDPIQFDIQFTDEYKLLFNVLKQIILQCFSSFFAKGATG